MICSFFNLCPQSTQSSLRGGGFGGLRPPKQSSKTPKLKHDTLEISGVFVNF